MFASVSFTHEETNEGKKGNTKRLFCTHKNSGIGVFTLCFVDRPTTTKHAEFYNNNNYDKKRGKFSYKKEKKRKTYNILCVRTLKTRRVVK